MADRQTTHTVISDLPTFHYGRAGGFDCCLFCRIGKIWDKEGGFAIGLDGFIV